MTSKAKQGQGYKDRPPELNAKEYRSCRAKERRHVRKGEDWKPKDLKVGTLLNFRGFQTLERWFAVTEEIGELLDRNDVAHTKALVSLTMSMNEGVAAGGD